LGRKPFKLSLKHFFIYVALSDTNAGTSLNPIFMFASEWMTVFAIVKL